MEQSWGWFIAGLSHDLHGLVVHGSLSHLVVHEFILAEHAQLHLCLHPHGLWDTDTALVITSPQDTVLTYLWIKDPWSVKFNSMLSETWWGSTLVNWLCSSLPSIIERGSRIYETVAKGLFWVENASSHYQLRTWIWTLDPELCGCRTSTRRLDHVSPCFTIQGMVRLLCTLQQVGKITVYNTQQSSCSPTYPLREYSERARCSEAQDTVVRLTKILPFTSLIH